MSSKKRKSSSKEKEESTSPVIHLFQWSLRLTILGLLFFIGFFGAVYVGVFGPVPTNEDLQNLINAQASEVYSKDGQVLGRYFLENRSEVAIEDISPTIIDALIATEDSRFYEHRGVDHQSMIRVVVKSIILGQNAGGGSTISQQLAKNVFGRQDHGWLTMPAVKAREIIIANKLNEVYTKDEILELYLNTVSLGEDTYGIKTACERFFSTSPADIKTEQAAVLIGMLKSPTSYNPRLNPEKSKRRRNVVLSQMEKQTFLTSEEASQLKDLPLELKYSRNTSEASSALHLTQHLRQQVQKLLEDLSNEEGDAYNLETDGLRIYTTIDSRMQQYAQEAVVAHLNQLQKAFDSDLKQQGKLSEEIDATLQSGFLVTNPHNGQVLAWVGGRDYQASQYDHILSERQVGSVFKPIVYAKALDDGYAPCDFISNQQVQYTQYDDWTPQNSSGEYDGSSSLLGGLTHSINTISVKLLMESGIEDVIAFAEQLGAKDDLPEVPSIALGVANMSVEEINRIYTPFASGGWQHQQMIIAKIEDANGNDIYSHALEQSERVLSARVAHQITNMMRSVADRGTARRIRNWYSIHDPIAAKTGTTQNHADGWFVGYTPEWLGVVWVGADDPGLHFSSIKDGQGANMALPIWAKFHLKVKNDSQLSERLNSYFSFPNDLADCELHREDNFLVKAFKKKTKKDRGSGLENSESKEESENQSDTPKKKKKKRFWDIFKKKK
ncbi:MAG: transglycosylase domain-containing protein [Reichenbachiella sp.]|uniref:transglycosylase domain-containing protein n=2 Tax=Reichenbachiella sp. TaxID=2184521 RepID=UPI003264E223